jgi:hypothetical protein
LTSYSFALDAPMCRPLAKRVEAQLIWLAAAVSRLGAVRCRS